MQGTQKHLSGVFCGRQSAGPPSTGFSGRRARISWYLFVPRRGHITSKYFPRANHPSQRGRFGKETQTTGHAFPRSGLGSRPSLDYACLGRCLVTAPMPYRALQFCHGGGSRSPFPRAIQVLPSHSQVSGRFQNLDLPLPVSGPRGKQCDAKAVPHRLPAVLG